MTLPELMSKIWDGDDAEYFTFIDMNRVEYNANICAKYAGVGTADFLVTTREGQFRYDEAQKLENLIRAIGAKLGVCQCASYNGILKWCNSYRLRRRTLDRVEQYVKQNSAECS